MNIDKVQNICYYVIMNEQTQTHKKDPLRNFVITLDDEMVTMFDPDTITNTSPTATQKARRSLIRTLNGIYANAKLESRMVAFDALHGTNYRQIRHNLVLLNKCERFERSIGIEPNGKKK